MRLMQKTMWMLGIVSCIMVSCRESAGNEYETLNKMAAEEYRTPLRPGYEGRNPYWNVYAKRFLYAPAFDFQEKDGAREYLFRISSDDGRREWTFTADAPWRPLSPVWDSVAVGNVSLTVLAIGQDGEVLDTAGTRRFFRDYPFHAPYNGPAVPYRESALKAALYIHSLPFVQRFATEKEAQAFLEKCQGCQFTISDVTKKPMHKVPAPPFTTSTLQQEAARKLGFSVAQTMSVAQHLYEAGLITYMRTDSVNLSTLCINASKKEIIEKLGENYSKVRQFQTKSKGAQEAHEAIRPTYMQNHEIKGGSNDKRLYDLIWKRTIASQMADAEIEKTTVRGK